MSSRWQRAARRRSNRALLLTALDVVAAGSLRSLAAFIVRALQQNAISLVTLNGVVAINPRPDDSSPLRDSTGPKRVTLLADLALMADTCQVGYCGTRAAGPRSRWAWPPHCTFRNMATGVSVLILAVAVLALAVATLKVTRLVAHNRKRLEELERTRLMELSSPRDRQTTRH